MQIMLVCSTSRVVSIGRVGPTVAADMLSTVLELGRVTLAYVMTAIFQLSDRPVFIDVIEPCRHKNFFHVQVACLQVRCFIRKA